MIKIQDKTYIEELKELHASLPEIIAALENFDTNSTQSMLQILSNNYDGPIDLLKQFEEDRISHADRLEADNVNPSYWPRIEKIIGALANDIESGMREQTRPPFTDTTALQNQLSELIIFDETQHLHLFNLSRLDPKYLSDFKKTLNVACGYFHLADGFYTLKNYIVSERGKYADIITLSADLRALLLSIQKPMFGFVIGNAHSGTGAKSLLLQFINLNRTITGLDKLQTLREDLLKSDQTAWMIGDQVGGHKANLPLYAFVHTLSQFLFERSRFATKQLPINQTNIRFIADCLKAFGVEYSDKRVKSTMEALKRKKPKLKTPRI